MMMMIVVMLVMRMKLRRQKFLEIFLSLWQEPSSLIVD